MGGRPSQALMRATDLDPAPTHVSTKPVRTYEITCVDALPAGCVSIRFPDGNIRPLAVSPSLDRGNGPHEGDRLIVYRDGYVSWCPRAVFEGGEYRPIADLATAIARVCHEVNSAICAEFGHDVPPPWDEAAEWQRKSAIDGVMFALANPDATPEQQHEAWREAKWADGWTIGPVKDPVAKEHPCLVEYEMLPADQRVKDRTFRAIVAEMARQGLPRVPRFTSADPVNVVFPTPPADAVA